jgi:pimeloyl-ACP methyl ester carboxylesterase
MGRDALGIAAAVSTLLTTACSNAAIVPPIIPVDTSAVIEESRLHTATGDLVGTTQIPAGRRPVPVVLIVAGSGPTDRNGNSIAGVSANSYKILAESLAARGFASVRYDKRGIAASAGAGKSEQDLRFDDYVADAVAWTEAMAKDARFSRVGIIGHSEGALLGALAAERGPVAGVVSLAGAGRRISEVLSRQLREAVPPISPADLATADSMLALLVAGRTIPLAPATFPPMLWFQLFRPSVQPYLISWFQHDPADVMARLKSRKANIQVVQGTTDLQVTVDDAQRLAAAAGVEPVLVTGMNHVLKLAPLDRAANAATYTQPDLPIPTSLVSALVSFLGGALR